MPFGLLTLFIPSAVIPDAYCVPNGDRILDLVVSTDTETGEFAWLFVGVIEHCIFFKILIMCESRIV